VLEQCPNCRGLSSYSQTCESNARSEVCWNNVPTAEGLPVVVEVGSKLFQAYSSIGRSFW
jgi:hypothetical protein